MQRGLATLAVSAFWTIVGCGGPSLQQRTVDLAQHLPATLEADRPREGDPRTVKVRVWADPGVRALPRWKEEIGEQIDYASQLLTPLVGVRLTIDAYRDWDRAGAPGEALARADRGRPWRGRDLGDRLRRRE